MSKYNDLELPALMDLLVKHTEEYTKMVTYKVFSVEEFTQCKQRLKEIHDAIKLRKGKLSANSIKEDKANNSYNSHEQQGNNSHYNQP